MYVVLEEKWRVGGDEGHCFKLSVVRKAWFRISSRYFVFFSYLTLKIAVMQSHFFFFQRRGIKIH